MAHFQNAKDAFVISNHMNEGIFIPRHLLPRIFDERWSSSDRIPCKVSLNPLSFLNGGGLKCVLALLAGLMFGPAALAHGDFRCADRAGLQLKMHMIASNIANIKTTRTPEGGPFQPYVDIRCSGASCKIGRSHKTLVRYERDHPDADDNGYVAYPDINLMDEMQNMIDTKRDYADAEADCVQNDRSSQPLRDVTYSDVEKPK